MAGYDSSKMNAQRWGTAVEGPIQCRHGCPYKRYFEQVCCKGGDQRIGMPCLVDRAYGDVFAESMRSEYPVLTEYRHDEFELLVDEAVRIALLRERLGCRSSRAWELPPKEMYAELDLTYRYWTAMHRRYLKVDRAIAELIEEVRVELEDRRWRRRALSSCIGGNDVPEPYRSWAKQVMEDYRRAAMASGTIVTPARAQPHSSETQNM